MKNSVFYRCTTLIISVILSHWCLGQQPSAVTNSFFDNDTLHNLKMSKIYVEGEIENPGYIKFDNLPVHSVIVKETTLGADGKPAFVGAYRYDGYSLADILNPFILKKNNANDFPPLTDLYIEIFNAEGQRVVISWGEIYYPNKQGQIIIAEKVMRIIPEKTGERWPLPEYGCVVVSNDLITSRNISNPVRIVIRSAGIEHIIEKGKFPLEKDFCIFENNGVITDSLFNLPEGFVPLTLHTAFYGKGRGLHTLDPFTGYNIKHLLEHSIHLNSTALSEGLIIFLSDDGYRAVFSLSELINRNDQEYTLLLFNPEDKKSGKFRVFPSCDFFSDRAVKGLSRIIYLTKSI